jgi:hypothetical protein
VVKKALAECAGLEGDRLRACWASYGARDAVPRCTACQPEWPVCSPAARAGCDVAFVTAHYTKVAGMPPPEGK